MGTIITLSVGGIDLDWSKNFRGTDHGMLFQDGDRNRLHSDQIDYTYFENEDDSDLAEMERGFSRKLVDVVPRIELLGYTLERIEAEYNWAVKTATEEQIAIDDVDGKDFKGFLSFQKFAEFMKSVAIESLDDTFNSSIDKDSDKGVMGRFSDEDTKKQIPFYDPYDSEAYSERSYFGCLIRFLHPYSALRLLAKVPENLQANVVWQYGPLVSAGWAKEEEFEPNARRMQTFLIVTEGTSDISILKKAISLLRPGIEDLFRFIDVSERHPFSGTGSLVKFAEGLAKIDVHNQVVFLLDNDAEGYCAHKKISELALPPNMRATMLPSIDGLRSIPCQGPEGVVNSDINQRAAAIECYLDFNAPGLPDPLIRWTNFKKETNTYQGALQQKDDYAKAFYKQTSKDIENGSYDVSKLTYILDELFGICCSLANNGQPTLV